jgi:hypothetical protein
MKKDMRKPLSPGAGFGIAAKVIVMRVVWIV